ncbi:MAG TPA: DUF3995 domain-containing protein [Archangium sp.]
MDAGLLLAAGSLVFLAVAHSALGEKTLIGPLLASPAFPALPVPAAFAKPTLRFAWHLTSLAWLALAWALLRGDSSRWPVALLLAVSGVVTHLSTRGHHFAWAVFVLGALGAAAGAASSTSGVVALLGAVLLTVLGGIHVAWAAGWRTGLGKAVPEIDGQPMFHPPVWATVGVALGLFTLAAVLASLGGWIPELPFTRLIGAAAAFVFGLRTLGDFRTVGLFKKPQRTEFARLDSLLYTPLSFALCAAFLWVR